jgi:hypothetical protein
MALITKQLWTAAAEGLPLPSPLCCPATVAAALRVLRVAIWNDRVDTMAELLDECSAKLRVNLVHLTSSIHVTSVLSFAALCGSFGAATRLLQLKAHVDGYSCCAIVPLWSAVVHGHTDVMRLLIAAHADVNCHIDSGKTVLMLAAQKGSVAHVQMLVDAGAVVDADDTSGNTPVFHAASAGNVDVLQVLVDANASVGRINNQVHTPLHLAAARGHLPVVRVLLQAKAHVDEYDVYRYTPVSLAAHYSHTDVLAVLVADVLGVPAHKGKMALRYVAQQGLAGAVELMTQACVDNDSTALAATRGGFAHGLALLLSAVKAQVDPPDARALGAR